MTKLEIIQSRDFAELKKLFNRPVFKDDQQEVIAQFELKKHKALDPAYRKGKTITVGSGEMDDNGKEKVSTIMVQPNRIGLNLEQLIVDRRVGFMLTIPVSYNVIWDDKETDKGKSLVKYIEWLQNNNEMDYKNKEIARRWMSELEVAEIWYFEETGIPKPKFTVKCNIWSPELGDTLYPLKSASGQMIAFAREYLIENAAGKKVTHFDVYTDEFEYLYEKATDGWIESTEDPEGNPLTNPLPNPTKKLMINYISQPRSEWHNEQPMIERLEESISNHGDMNDYFGSPILAVTGEIMGFAAKGEQGKILQLADQAKANFLALEGKPESIKMEQDNLIKLIFGMSQTPDISFEAMRGMGTIAQFTMKAFFMDAHMAVGRKEESFGVFLQNRINILKRAIASLIDTSYAKEAEALQIKPVITPFLPENTTEMIENLVAAKQGGIMAVETTVNKNTMIDDKELEMTRLKQDQDEAASLNQGVFGDDEIKPLKKVV